MTVNKFVLFINVIFLFFTLASGLLDCECGTQPLANNGMRGRIVGGKETIPHAYPWIVAIKSKNYIHCGGSLITNNHVLTAGHCVKWNDFETLRGEFGVHDLDESEGVIHRNFTNVVIHKNFDSDKIRDEFDIAILTLNSPVEFSDKVLPVCLPPPLKLHTGKLAILTGWGRQKEDAPPSDVLLQVRLKVIDNEKCSKTPRMRKHLKSHMVCAFANGKDGCQGDSGGPLVYETYPGKFEQIGVVSWGIGCANPKYPGVYTTVSYFIDWIKEHTEGGDICKE